LAAQVAQTARPRFNLGMRISASILLCLGLTLWSASASASADTYYRYRDKSTGRDVYVNRLDQVPQKYRSQAKIVLETDQAQADPDKEPSTEVVVTSPQPESKPVRRPGPSDSFKEDLRKALSNKNLLRDGPMLACTAIDFKLAAAGAQPLSMTERSNFAALVMSLLVASLVAGLAALVAWVVVIVTAVRDERLWWAFFIFIFSPLGYLYLFIHGGRGRALFKSLCALGMLAPLLVGAIGAWRFYAWFQTIMQARGVHI
jgi:hypothetical protein